MDRDIKRHQPGRSGRGDGWYMHGWRKESVTLPGGKMRAEWVYRGEYYDYAPDAPRLTVRVSAAVCALILAGAYVLGGLMPSAGVLTAYVAYPYFLELLPIFYFLMGSFWLVYTPGPMTHRRFHASFRRLRTAAWAGAVWMAVPFLAELVLLLRGETGSYGRELTLLGCMLVCEGQYGMMLLLTGRYPVTEVEEEAKSGAR